jgi:hypothetical protein
MTSCAATFSQLQEKAEAADNGQNDSKLVKPCETAKPKSWIEIRLLDEESKPVPNIRYRIKLTDGSTREGSLDGAGIARFEDIDAGTCEVSFPALDSAAWSPIETS